MDKVRTLKLGVVNESIDANIMRKRNNSSTNLTFTKSTQLSYFRAKE